MHDHRIVETDRMTYISGLNDLIELKKEHPEDRMILHRDYTEEKTISKIFSAA